MIFVIGGTGTVGRNVVDELVARAAPARLLVRDTEKAGALERKGFDVVSGDLERPGELQPLLTGVETLFLLSPQHPRQRELQENLVGTAGRAGVRRIVKISGSSAVTHETSASWVGRAHWHTEEQIKRAGIAYVFLRPNYFMQNLLTLADPIRSGSLPVPIGDARVAMIDARDVGAVAAEILVSDGQHDGRVYDLTGPESLTFTVVAERLARVLGHDVRHVDPPLEVVVASMRERGAPDWLGQHVQQVMEIFRSGAGEAVAPTVDEILGRPPRTIDAFARDEAAAFA